jgi:hypothetical protein
MAKKHLTLLSPEGAEKWQNRNFYEKGLKRQTRFVGTFLGHRVSFVVPLIPSFFLDHAHYCPGSELQETTRNAIASSFLYDFRRRVREEASVPT